MRVFRNKLISLLLLLTVLPALPVTTRAEEVRQAQDISSSRLVTQEYGLYPYSQLFDDDHDILGKAKEQAGFTLEYAEGMGSLYLQFLSPYGPYTITDNSTGTVFTAGTNNFLHEFVDLVACFGHAPTSVSIDFQNGPVQLHELDVYTEGEVPSTVQKWELPEEGAVDLLLFATHSDDDQLFFAGLLPYYAIERGYEVHVAYLTDHYNNMPYRVYEVLNGLWAVGVTNHPSFAGVNDFRKNTVEEVFQEFEKQGHSREALTGFVVEQLRRYKPIVAVGHDPEGEYGHIQHIVYSLLLQEAVELSNDPKAYPEIAAKYGLWDVPKTYLHLYEENPIVMDWDRAMAAYNGLTPFEVTRDYGFPAHRSQQKAWGWYYYYKKKATDITAYSPCAYGLYRSTVGLDTEKNDMFENVLSHTEQARSDGTAHFETTSGSVKVIENFLEKTEKSTCILKSTVLLYLSALSDALCADSSVG